LLFFCVRVPSIKTKLKRNYQQGIYFTWTQKKYYDNGGWKKTIFYCYCCWLSGLGVRINEICNFCHSNNNNIIVVVDQQ
jgi:hypothetical protein